ncbi:unnamed protein product [Acanthocheilonema viteae]|uniref:Uncharacterized protein n=1 Tax=Acanthocheilonema viteae TaxID=6277 RepID=A0A498SQE7_ACAVI|nr:unnamed protein product [Acanthocheilonema viteae]
MGSRAAVKSMDDFDACVGVRAWITVCLLMMADKDQLISQKASSDADSNSNNGSLFSHRYPDETLSSSSGSKENTQLLLNNESSLSPKLQSHGAETIPTVRRCRRFNDAFPEGLKFQPKMTREDSIDLSTNEEKSNSDDEWFIQKINPKSGTHSTDGNKNSENSQASRSTTREDVQKCMMKRLVEMRLRNQEKRKAMYAADNEIMFDESKSMEIDLSGRIGEESKAKPNSGETLQKSSMAIEVEDEKAKFGLIQDEEDGDRQKDLLVSREETCENLMKHEDHKSYLPGSETESSDLSDETESEYGSSSLVDDLLSDVADNCSGSFDYPEEKFPKLLKKTVLWLLMAYALKDLKYLTIIMVLQRPPEYYSSEEYYRLVRKRRRKHRLILSTRFYDEESIKAWRRSGRLLKKVKRILLDEDEEDDEAFNTSDHNEESDSDVLDENDKREVNNKRRLFVDDDYKRDEIEPSNEENDDEDQRVKGIEEAESNDELEQVRKLQITQKRQKKSEYIEEEASLSGEDVGSDESDEEQMNVYEAEEGDNDELPDDETIREQLHKQWVKQQRDEEERKLLYWKDQLHVDGDVTDETDRTFRFKLRLAKSDNVDEKIDNVTVDAENVEVDDDELYKRRREISKWKMEERKGELLAESTSVKETNPLLKAALKVIDKGSLDGNSQSHETAGSSLSKNSLLHHCKSLPQVLNETKTTLYTKSADADSAQTDEYTEVLHSQLSPARTTEDPHFARIFH